MAVNNLYNYSLRRFWKYFVKNIVNHKFRFSSQPASEYASENGGGTVCKKQSELMGF